MKLTSLNNRYNYTVFQQNNIEAKQHKDKLTFKDLAIATTLLGFASHEASYSELVNRYKNQTPRNKVAGGVFCFGMVGLLASFIYNLDKKWLKIWSD